MNPYRRFPIDGKPVLPRMPQMAKKKATAPKRLIISLYPKSVEEREQFRSAAEEEGFGSMAAWMMYHLRNQAKQTLADRKD